MTPQEKDLLTTLLTRLKNTPSQPKDPEADALIRQALAEQPDMPYYLTQTVLIQDLSLHQAQQRITELERQLTDAQQQAAQPAHTSFLGSLFGSRQQQPSAPPPSSGSVPAAGPWARAPQVAAAPPAQPYGQPYAQQPGYGPQGGMVPRAAMVPRVAALWAVLAVLAAGFCARRPRRQPGSPVARCCSRGSSRYLARMPAPALWVTKRE